MKEKKILCEGRDEGKSKEQRHCRPRSLHAYAAFPRRV